MVETSACGVVQSEVLSEEARADRVEYCTNVVTAQRVVVDVQQLLSLLGPTCKDGSGCRQNTTDCKAKLNGYGCKLHWVCAAGHSHIWSSSSGSNDVNDMTVMDNNNVLFSAAILLSGNSFQKIKMFCRFLGLAYVSRSTFYRYVLPPASLETMAIHRKVT